MIPAKTYLLLLETATDVCSVAIADMERIIACVEKNDPYIHASQASVFVQQCLQEAGLQPSDLSSIAVSKGPGQYTSLRVGSSLAKGLCFGLNIPFLAVDTLQSLADAARLQYPNASYYLPMIDARRMEVYTSLFDSQGQCLETPQAQIVTPDLFASHLQTATSVVLCGNGAEKCRETLSDAPFQYADIACSAPHLATAARQAYTQNQWEDTAYFSPFYLKPPAITVAKKGGVV